jgi:hypothetical protein
MRQRNGKIATGRKSAKGRGVNKRVSLKHKAAHGGGVVQR